MTALTPLLESAFCYTRSKIEYAGKQLQQNHRNRILLRCYGFM